MKILLIAFTLFVSISSLFAQTNIFDWGVAASSGTKYTDSFYIFNIGVDPSQYSTYKHTANVFNFGADCSWQSQFNDSWNIMNMGFATGEFTTFSQSHNLIFQGSEAGTTGMFFNSSYHYLYGHNAGYGMTSYKSSDIYSLGGLKKAYLTLSKNVVAIGNGSGDGLVGSYTNVFLIGAGATLPPKGKDILATSPNMKLQLGSTNQWQFGGVSTNVDANVFVKVTINNKDYYLLAIPAN